MKYLAASLILIGFTNFSNGQAGLLDSTFNYDGIVNTDVNGLSEEGYSITIQNDSKIVVAGVTFNGVNTDFVVCRYHEDGLLDQTFGINGIVTTDFFEWENANSVAIDPFGNIVVAGLGRYLPTGSAVARYKSNGLLDSSFNEDGRLTAVFATKSIQCHAMDVEPGGKVILAGLSNYGNDHDYGLIRYHVDGTMDSLFGNDGTVYTDFDGKKDNPRAMKIQQDGKVVVCGRSYDDNDSYFSIARYQADGNLDTTFNNNGKVITNIGVSGYAMALQPDGKIVIAGNFDNAINSDFALLRYLSDGTLDSSFGSNGFSSIDINGSTDQCTSVTIQEDGKIILAGYTYDGTYQDIALTRFNSNGSLDLDFGMGGMVVYDISGVSDYGRSAAIQQDGKILIAGGSLNDIMIIRLLSGWEVGVMDISPSQSKVSVSPNPFQSRSVFTYSLSDDQTISLNFYDFQERLVQSFFSNQWRGKGEHHEQLDFLPLLPAGNYLLRMRSGKEELNLKLIKQ